MVPPVDLSSISALANPFGTPTVTDTAPLLVFTVLIFTLSVGIPFFTNTFTG